MKQRNPSDIEDLVRRYEAMKGKRGGGYLDVDDIGKIADYYAMKGEQKKAWETIKTGLRLHPNEADLYAMAAGLQYMNRNHERALRWVNRALEVEDNPDYRLLKGEILCVLGRKDEGMEEFEAVIRFDKGEEDLTCHDVADFFSEDLEDHETAAKYLRRALGYNPRNEEARYALGVELEWMDRDEEALAVFGEVLKRDVYSKAWFEVGKIKFKREEYADAEKAFDYCTVIEMEEDEVQLVMLGSAICKENRQDWNGAMRAYEQLLRDDSENVDAIGGMGRCLNGLKRWDEAIPWLKRALAKDEMDWDIYYHLGDACAHMKETESTDWTQETLRVYDRLLAVGPGQADVLLVMAGYYVDEKRWAEALALLEEAEWVDANARGVDVMMAVVHTQLGHTDTASYYLAKAIVSDREKNVALYVSACPGENEVIRGVEKYWKGSQE